MALPPQRLAHAEEILAKVRIPSQPIIIAELNQRLNAPQPDFKEIAALISQDSAVTARLFKLINSPLFGRCREIDSISQALALLGTENFFKLIFTSCLRESINTDRQLDERFWQHTLRVAVGADHIAGRVGAILALDNITPGQCYLAGLFHDCAVPILSANFKPYLELFDSVASYSRSVLAAEDQAVGTDHCIIGHLMAKSWSLPDPICKAVLFHHEEVIINEKLHMPTKLLAVLQTADYLAFRYDYLAGQTPLVLSSEWSVDEWAASHENVLTELALEVDDIKHFKNELFDRYADIS